MADEKYLKCGVCGQMQHCGDYCIRCGNSQWVETKDYFLMTTVPWHSYAVCTNDACKFRFEDSSIFPEKRHCPKCGAECTAEDAPPRMS